MRVSMSIMREVSPRVITASFSARASSSDLAVALRPDLEPQPPHGAEVALEDVGERVDELVGGHLGQEAERAEVDAEDRHAARPRVAGDREQRPVAAEDDEEVRARGHEGARKALAVEPAPRLGVEQHLDAALGEPLVHAPRDVAGRGRVGLHAEPDAADGTRHPLRPAIVRAPPAPGLTITAGPRACPRPRLSPCRTTRRRSSFRAARPARAHAAAGGRRRAARRAHAAAHARRRSRPGRARRRRARRCARWSSGRAAVADPLGPARLRQDDARAAPRRAPAARSSSRSRRCSPA